jgi:nanoRNase/pAp phosphatase (c-di-AMP/oligoRNAs hydrolase)
LGGYLDLKIKVEILDVLTLLLTTRKDTAHKMCSTWVKNFENYTNESAILISHLLTYKPNILKSSVYWKKLQQTSISKAMVIMEKKTRKLIGTTKGSAKSKLIVLQREIRVFLD